MLIIFEVGFQGSCNNEINQRFHMLNSPLFYKMDITKSDSLTSTALEDKGTTSKYFHVSGVGSKRVRYMDVLQCYQVFLRDSSLLHLLLLRDFMG